MAPPGGWKVPQLIEGSKSYQPEVEAHPLHTLPPAQCVMVPLNDLGPPDPNFLYPPMITYRCTGCLTLSKGLVNGVATLSQGYEIVHLI